eukprot:COSAG02_NODE_44093_length_369_cov_0.577778_1_plen_55_part_10
MGAMAETVPPTASMPVPVTDTNIGPSPERGEGGRNGDSVPLDSGITAKQTAEPEP